jgi:polysaccharide biosynthesis protein PslJ
MTTAPHASTALSQNGALDNFVAPPARERTMWLLAVLCLLIGILPAYLVPPGPLKSNGSPVRLIASVLFGLAVLGFVLSRRTARTRTVNPGAVGILVYFLLLLAVYGVGLSHLGDAVVEASKARALQLMVAYVGVALYALTRVKTVRQRSVLLGCLAIGLTFNCVVGFLQASTHIDLHSLFAPPGFVDNQVDIGRGLAASFAQRFGARRAFGTAGHAIEFSVLAAVTVPLTIHFVRYAANKQVRLLAAVALAVALLAMPAGVSRSGVITLAVAFLVYMWTFKLRALGVAVVAGALALLIEFAAAPALPQALWKTIINSSDDGSVLERIGDYARVSQTFSAHPLFGLGLGASIPADYGFLDNEWLQAIVQGGIVQVLAMIVLSVGGIFGIAAALRRATTRRERDQAYMMGAMFAGILASSYTFDLLAYAQVSLVFFILVGLLWSNFTVSFPEGTSTRAVAEGLAAARGPRPLWRRVG